MTVNGTTTQLHRAAQLGEGGRRGSVDSFSAPDLSGNGCGPGGAIDGSQATGWGSTSPTSSQGPGGAKQITIKLPQPITLGQYAVDPGATCGDDDNASVGSYKIETSTNGTAFTQTNSGTFTAANNHKLNHLTPGGGTANVRYVRFTMNAPQSSSGSGADWMDMSELKVYGAPAADTTRPGAKPPTDALREGARAAPTRRRAARTVQLAGRLRRHHADGRPALSPAGERGRWRVHERDGFPRGAEGGPGPGAGQRLPVPRPGARRGGQRQPRCRGPTVHTEVREENAASLNYVGRWLARMARANASGGFVRPTTTVGANATNTFSARDMAVVMPTTSTLGSARICLDDLTAGTTVRCRTVDLSPATGTGPRQFVYAEHGLDAAIRSG